jgi:protein TonB
MGLAAHEAGTCRSPTRIQACAVVGWRSRVDFAQQQRNPGKHMVGIGIVLVLHLLLGWAMVTGLAQRVVDVIRAPIETKIIEETQRPPPPPPENLPPPPPLAPPPPSFVPPPEVNVAPPPTPAPQITVTREAPPPAPVVVVPAPAPAPPAPPPVVAAAPPAPPAPPVRVPPRLNFGTACERPEYSAAARRAEAQGEVVVRFTADATGRIVDAVVERSAGPTREHKMLDRLTLEAVRACRVTPGTLDGKPETLTERVTYVWKITD